MSMKKIALGRWVRDTGQLIHCSECSSNILRGITVEAVKGKNVLATDERVNTIPNSMRLFHDSELAGDPTPENDSVFIFFRCSACKQLLMLLIKQKNSQIFMSIGLAAEEEERRANLPDG